MPLKFNVCVFRLPISAAKAAATRRQRVLVTPAVLPEQRSQTAAMALIVLFHAILESTFDCGTAEVVRLKNMLLVPKSRKYLFHLAAAATLFFCAVFSVLASSADGTIDGTFKYAWGEKIGWLNFGAATGTNAVHITSAGLTGYVWSANFGWIKLNPANAGVKNTTGGALSGSAWGERLGFIDFTGATISGSGVFTGTAAGGNLSGKINFDCANCKVVTDWRPNASSPSPSPSPAPIGIGGGTGYQAPPPSPAPQPEAQPAPPPSQSSLAEINQIMNWLLHLFQPAPPSPPPTTEIIVPQVAPPAFRGAWQLVPANEVNQFVFAPLPKDVALFVKKFPGLKKTFEQIGIAKQSDLKKLSAAKLSLPGLTEVVGLNPSKLQAGGLPKVGELPLPSGLALPTFQTAHFGLPTGVPVAELSAGTKQAVPTGVVFARTGGEKIDMNIGLTLNAAGVLEQHIQTVAGSALNLVVKPEAAVKRIKGYFVLKDRTGGETGAQSNVSFASSLTAIVNQFAQTNNVPPVTSVENRFVLLEFEYTDPDHDGVYTANIHIPRADGEYEIITRIDYQDEKLGSKEIRMTAVVDPEGYVYEKNNGKETRIPGAIVSLYVLSPQTNQYELWPAKDYRQKNPQVTDVAGTYAFLVPEGYYYLSVSAPGYESYRGRPFEVTQGNEVHFNIELTSPYSWLQIADWKTLLLILVTLLLLYNFYKDWFRGKMTKK